MNRKRLWLAAVLVLLAVICAGSASASIDSLKFTMELSASSFSEPKTITVSISVTNTGSSEMPGPVSLYYPDGQMVEEFGFPVLQPGETRNWSGPWTVTKEELEAGKIAFIFRYPDFDENGEPKEKPVAIAKHIQYTGGTPVIEVSRTIMPQTADEGQTVSIIYEIANKGISDVTGVKIQENSAISKSSVSVGTVRAGETAKHTFTVKMKKKNLTSAATISYKSGGKAYTSKVETATIKYGKVNLTATLSADKKGGAPGETVKLTLKLKNTGKKDVTDVTVTDGKLGIVFSGQTVKAGTTVTLEKELTVTETTELQFAVRGKSGDGDPVETATGAVKIIATDPEKLIALQVEIEPDRTEVDAIPADVRFKVTVYNKGTADVENVSVKARDVRLYTFGNIPAGESRYFIRDTSVQKEGVYLFTASVKDQLGQTISFDSNSVEITEAPQKTNSKPTGTDSRPEPKAEGWDIQDLTGYPLENAVTEQKTRAELMNNGLLLVNEWHVRPGDFDESGIKSVGKYLGGNAKVQVDNYNIALFPVASDALLEAVDAARAEGMEHYIVTEGYRSWEKQNELFENKKKKLASKYSNEDDLTAAAKKEVSAPGTSEFNSGLSFTLRLYEKGNSEVNSAKYSTTEQGVWMNENSWKYGLIFRFPQAEWPLPTTQDKSHKTGISLQMNLYRYVGKGNAAFMHYLDMCLEEYIEYLHDHPHLALYEDGVLKYEVYCQYVGDEGIISLETVGGKEYDSSLDNMGYAVTVITH